MTGKKEKDKGTTAFIPSSSRNSSTVKGDEKNLVLLFALYVLQGIPLGLSASIPILLSQRGLSYNEQAEFSFAFWPFSLKLLWAPIVDSLYFSSFGRRKSWLIPLQYALSGAFYWLSTSIDGILESRNLGTLTLLFFSVNFLAASQDIVVDGWALTMLQSQNVHLASVCNSVGQTAGYFAGYVGYMILESYGLLSLSDFCYFWSIVFFVFTSLIGLFISEESEKKESNQNGDNWEGGRGVVAMYTSLMSICKLEIMPTMMITLLTSKMAFAATDAVTSLKLIEAGVSKDTIVLLGIPMIPLQILLPILISRFMHRPFLSLFQRVYPARLGVGVLLSTLVFLTPVFKGTDGSFSPFFYTLLLLVYGIHQIVSNCMYVPLMAFFNSVSDPFVGGTYMTLLNTLTNLGGNWPATTALWLVDPLTTSRCTRSNTTETYLCFGRDCKENNEICVTFVDGYYVESFGCLVLGFLWLYFWGSKAVPKLDNASSSQWKVVDSQSRLKKSHAS